MDGSINEESVKPPPLSEPESTTDKWNRTILQAVLMHELSQIHF